MLLQLLQNHDYDLCFLSTEYLERIRIDADKNPTNLLPIILLKDTAPTVEQVDFLGSVIDSIDINKLSAELLESSINYAIRQIQNRKRLDELTYYDSLTQLPNRTYFQHRLSTTIARSARGKKAFSLVLIDIDRFKRINDSLGHEYGDQLLVHISNIIKSNLRQNDMAARLGNDEFAIILETDQSSHFVKRLMRQCSEILRLKDKDIRVSASVGIANFPKDGNKGSELMRAADSAMLTVKQRGGDDLCFFDPRLQQNVIERSWIETEFQHALDSDQLYLVFQPQVSADGKSCQALEALCRWHHPEKGLISPATFIPIIEKTPMIIELGKWVLETACEALVFLSKLTTPMKIAVNISMMQISHANFVADITQILAKTGADAGMLELELTESSLMIDPLQSISTLTALRNLGINIAIDDFGTGHSSLAYLVDLPIDTLKIDRSFTFEFFYNRKRESVIKAIIALARSLGLNTVAEGVENQRTAEYLLSLGCDFIQGYYISQPISLEDVISNYAGKKISWPQS